MRRWTSLGAAFPRTRVQRGAAEAATNRHVLVTCLPRARAHTPGPSHRGVAWRPVPPTGLWAGGRHVRWIRMGTFRSRCAHLFLPSQPRLCKLGGHVIQTEQLRDRAGTRRRRPVQETRARCVLRRSRGALWAEKGARGPRGHPRDITAKFTRDLGGPHKAELILKRASKGGGLPCLMPPRVRGRSPKPA